MGDKNEELSQAAATETSPNTFWKDLADFLKAHQELLPSLPEMCERFAEIDWKMKTGTELQSPGTSRQEELIVPEKSKEADLKKRFDRQMTIKREKITALKKENKQKDKEIELLKEQFSKKEEELEQVNHRVSKKEEELEQLKHSNDELVEGSDKKDQKLKEYSDRNEELMKEINKQKEKVKEYSARNDELKKGTEKMEEKVKAYSERNTRLEGQLQQNGRELVLAKKELDEKKEDWKVAISAKDAELDKMTSRNKQLKEKCRERLTQKDEELNKMRNRLAYLSEKQVKRDQRQVEDTAASNRPSDVEKDFAAFCDEDRMDACDKMQDIYGSEEEVDVMINYPRLACMIFETAYEEMKEIRDAVAELFTKIITNMTISAPAMGHEYCSRKESGVIPSQITLDATVCRQQEGNQGDVLDALSLSLKETSHVCNLQPLQQRVTSKVTEKRKIWLAKESSCTFSVSEQLLGELNDYIQACIRLSWRIVTQVPPMQIEYQSSILRNIHKNLGYHVSPERRPRMQHGDELSPVEELRIACYLWPGLFDGGGRPIRTGEVLCQRKSP